MSNKLLQFLCEENWAISEDYLKLGAQIIFREHEADFEAVAAKKAARLDGTSAAKMREGGIAVIEVVGPITRYASFFSDFCGGASVDILARDFNSALNDPSVRAILFKVDSPGGSVTGINEFAQMIFDARGKKRIVCYTDGLVASALYWVASACDEIVMDATGLAGSIGVISRVSNPDAERSRDLVFTSSQSPNKNAKPNTTSGAAQIQQVVDDLAQVFVETVARNRGITVDEVLEKYGQGAVMVGQRAVDAGLVDRLGSFEQVVAELASGKPMKRKSKPAMAAIVEAENEEKDDMKFSEVLAKFGISLDDAKAELATESKAETSSDEVAKLQAALAAEQAEKNAIIAKQQAEAKAAREAEAKAFAESIIAGSLALPAERDAIEAGYLHCAENETALVAFKAGYEKRATHDLTKEKLNPETLKVLPSDASADLEAQEKLEIERLKKLTPLGRATLTVAK